MEGQTYGFPNELVSIDANALSGVTISSINIGANLKIVSGANSLHNFNVGQIIINNSNPNIKSVNNLAILSADGTKFFKYADLSLGTTYSVPNGVTYIDKNALAYSDNLVEIRLPDGLREANQEAFYDCDKLTTINFPDSYKSSGWRVLANCTSLENVTIKGTVSPQTFQNSYKLKNVIYDVSCTSIGYNQFTNIDALQSVTILSPTLPKLPTGDPFGTNKPSATNNYKIYVVDELVEQYRAYSYFANYADYIYPVSQKPAS